MKQDNLLSIIICTLGSRDIIKRCLDSIYIENTQSIKYEVIVVDPKVNVEEVNREYGIKIYTEIPKNKYDILILAVPHNQFLKLNFNSFLNSKSIIYDVKGVLKFKTDGRL